MSIAVSAIVWSRNSAFHNFHSLPVDPIGPLGLQYRVAYNLDLGAMRSLRCCHGWILGHQVPSMEPFLFELGLPEDYDLPQVVRFKWFL